jgi:prepilin-type N-terminal cleavage/methylation domain-containing protein
VNNLKKYLNGFTLVEILIVVVIVGILAAIAIPTYYSYVKKGYATEAKTQLKSIVQAADMYYSERGEPAPDVETMETEGYIELKQSVKNKWEFDLNLDPNGDGGSASATSTEEMSGGAGEVLTYDVATGKFTGYGQGSGQ